jgi:hypothetical protein
MTLDARTNAGDDPPPTIRARPNAGNVARTTATSNNWPAQIIPLCADLPRQKPSAIAAQIKRVGARSPAASVRLSASSPV